ncbi:MAG: DNA alkylation repair protein [Elusimicrobiaceae bacterium]|nr:DNA alkylation repair protein [Elusimicrobiaceae bacterium]
MKIADIILQHLSDLSNPKTAAVQLRFFKTGPGEYGEGDRFLGVTLPQTRHVVKEFFMRADWTDLEKLFACEWHEARACAVLILVAKFEKAKTAGDRKKIFDFYVAHLPRANNWDLIDISAYKIIGAYLADKKDRGLLFKLAQSENLWEQRAAVVSTMYFVKRGEFGPTIALAEKFFTHQHDLMHKATGWLLREVGKKDERVLRDFLDKHAARMPRTMLRYSIEKLTPEQKKIYMGK